MQTYAHSQHQDGHPYIGDYLDGATGQWINGDNARARFYNHSTFNDLIITGLAGIVPRADSTIEIDPLLPSNAWDWFCLQDVPYHGQQLTIVWDRDGKKFGVKPGLTIFAKDRQIAHSPDLSQVTGNSLTVAAMPASPLFQSNQATRASRLQIRRFPV